MLAYQPSNRYQSAEDVIKDLPPTTSVTPVINISNPMQSSNNSSNQNSNISRLRTIAFAPAKTVHSQAQLAVNKIPMPEWMRPFMVTFVIVMGVGLTGAGVMAVGRAVVASVTSIELPKVESPKIPSLGNSGNTGSRNRTPEAIFQRVRDLEISESVFTQTVDQRFYTVRSGLQGRTLTDKPEDRVLREQWNSVADEMLKNIERADLSPEARRKIGTYSQEYAQRWDRLARTGRLGKYRSFEQLRRETYQEFEPLFPGQRRGNLKRSTYMQFWYAIAYDKVENE